jgi:hypothetical protein
MWKWQELVRRFENNVTSSNKKAEKFEKKE